MSDAPDAGVEELPDDPEVPVEDALEQAAAADLDPDALDQGPIATSRRRSAMNDDIEVPAADAWEQSQPNTERDDY